MVKKSISLVLLVCGLLSNLYAKDNVVVHPEFWWAGMKNANLQVLIHADGAKDLSVDLQGAKGVILDSVVTVENPNYLFLYFNAAQAKPQRFDIRLKRQGKLEQTINYELKSRRNRRLGSFDASDAIYLLMPDRFADGTVDSTKKQKMYEGMRESHWGQRDMERHGGDLAGMTAHLDYLSDLGITAIWPTPTLENNQRGGSYHGYAITNYYRTDPRLGTNDDYCHFVDECHKRGIKVVMDIVFNHCGSENFLFKDLPGRDWFNNDSQYTQSTYKTGMPADPYAAERDKFQAVDGWFTRSMPDLNGRNKLVADYLIQSSIWWVEYAGVDGYRQDTYPYMDFDFSRRWCMDLEREYPGFNVVGETWVGNSVGIAYWQKDSPLAAPRNSELPTVMDFPLMNAIGQAVDEQSNGGRGLGRIHELLSQDIIYANPNSILTFLANHDTNRFQPTKEKAENVNRYRQALTLLLTLRGIPQLYYGDEIGMFANKSVNDGALRQNFPGGWKGDENNAFTAEGRTPLQNEYFDFTRKLLNWRKANRTIAFGKMIHYDIQGGVYVYARQLDGKTITVLMNGTDRETSIDRTYYKEVLSATTYHDVIQEKDVTFGDKIEFQPRQILILE